jgi:hypothetical protein
MKELMRAYKNLLGAPGMHTLVLRRSSRIAANLIGLGRIHAQDFGKREQPWKTQLPHHLTCLRGSVRVMYIHTV